MTSSENTMRETGGALRLEIADKHRTNCDYVAGYPQCACKARTLISSSVPNNHPFSNSEGDMVLIEECDDS